MNNYNRSDGGYKSGGSKFGGNSRPRDGKRFVGGGNRSGGQSELFKANCSDCGKSCEVPFRPSGDKPVFCSECFGHKKSESNRGDDRQRNAPPRQQFSQPSGRPDAPRTNSDAGLADVKRQLTVIEQRLNRILDLLNPPLPAIKNVKVEMNEDVKEVSIARGEKKIRSTTIVKKVPSKADIKEAVVKAMVSAPEEVVVKKERKKAPAKVAAKKAVVKKIKN